MYPPSETLPGQTITTGMPEMTRVAIRSALLAAALASACSIAVPALAGPAETANESNRMPVRGIVRPLNQAAIATEAAMQVSQIHIREAEAFRKGDLLVAFDCERLEAEQAAADALQREMRLAVESSSYLEKRGAIGHLEVEVARARMDKAAAEAQALRARLKQCAVVAPFDGRVTELSIHEHEFPVAGKPFLGLVDETVFEIDLIVPSFLLKSLEPGVAFKFLVDETGRAYDAKVTRLGAAVDPVSQTVKIIAAFDNKDERVLAGMSGTADLPGLDHTQ